MSPRLWMLAAGAAVAGGFLFAMPPAQAQFGTIFGNPRPPADVPGRGPVQLDPLQEPDEADMPPDVQPLPPQPRMPDRARTAPTLPPPGVRPRPGTATPNTATSNTFPNAAPNNSGIQSAPLAPPPGSIAAPTEPAASDANPNPPFNPQAVPAHAPASAPDANDVIVTEPPAQKIVNKRALFAGLDKITGRIIAFDVAIDETVQFGALQVTPKACYTRPPTEPQNTDGFVVVDEVTLQGEVRRIFTGWMFAASPGLHAVEHPIYDVWLTDCKEPDAPTVAQTDTPAAAQATPPKKPPPKPKPTTATPQRPRPPLDPFR